MDISKISIGKNAPHDVNVIIEIPANSGPIKYEFNKEAGVIEVDRIMQTAFSYPCNYGFVPHTLSGDGDPVDVLVYTNVTLHPGVVISARPIGVLMTEDENGADEKILAVPSAKIDPYFAEVDNFSDLPKMAIEKIEHFFTNYKALEKGKWVKVAGWQDAAKARDIISQAIQNAQ